MSNRAIITFATGEYNQYVPKLIETAKQHFNARVYVFTDQPDKYENAIEIKDYGWPQTPLLRWEIMKNNLDVFKEVYLFLVDADVEFKKRIENSVLGHRVAVLHRNITRLRDEFNYETRIKSTAYVAPDEGEKYYAAGFVGGHQKEFTRMCEVMADNIRADIRNGIRAIWGDESHLNRYLIDNPPTTVLPPNYMCPETNPYFVPFIQHQDKQFKRINKEDAEEYLTINPEDYEL